MARKVGPVDLPVPPQAGPADPRMTVMSFVEEARAVRKKHEDVYAAAEVQEAIVLGEMLAEQDPTVSTNVPLYTLKGEMHENSLLPAVETMVARISQGRIDSKAWPRTPHPQRIAAAEGANLMLDFERARDRRDMQVHESLFFALLHGKSGIYTVWDKSLGPYESVQPVLNPVDNQPMFDAGGYPVQQLVEDYGANRTEVLSCFQFWSSGEDDPQFERWQVVRKLVDKWTAKKALQKAGINRDPDEVTVTDYGYGRRGKGMTGVEVLEIWIKPSAQVEAGTFMRVVDNCAVQVDAAYPYKHRRLPVSELLCMRVRGSPHGHTKVKDAIFLQRLQDVALRAILRRADMAKNAWLAGTSQVIDPIAAGEDDGLLRVDGATPAGQAVSLIEGPEIPDSLMAVKQMAAQGILNVLGVSSESVTGGDPGSTSSGEQLKTASALDSQKDVPLRRRCEEAWQEVDRQKLENAQQFMTNARWISVLGDPVRAGYFSGADLDGVDLSLEQSSGLVESPLGRARAAEEGAAAGYVSPQDAGEQRQTGLVETTMSAEKRARVQRQGIEALRGKPQIPLPDVPPQAAVEQLRGVYAQVPKGNTALLLRLIGEYQQMGMMQAAPQMQAQGATQGAPGAPAPPKQAAPKVPKSTQNAIAAQEPIQ